MREVGYFLKNLKIIVNKEKKKERGNDNKCFLNIGVKFNLFVLELLRFLIVE